MTTVIASTDPANPTAVTAYSDFQNDTRTRTLIILNAITDANGVHVVTNANNVIYDFMPNGAPTLSPSRDIVTEAACNSCHKAAGYGFIHIVKPIREPVVNQEWKVAIP